MNLETHLWAVIGIVVFAFIISLVFAAVYPVHKRPAIIIFPDGSTVSASHAYISNRYLTWESDNGKGTAGLTGVRVLWKENGK